jgi:uncharacterized membrane protein
MDPIVKIFLFLTIFLMSLIAGLFYAYSVSVNPGLNKLSDIEYLKAMKSINRAILNPRFFLSFIGTLVITPGTTALYFRNVGADSSFYLLLISSVIYIVGVFGVTMLGNVPLNNTLDALTIANQPHRELKSGRLQFEMPWNRLHTIRTVANLSSLALALLALITRID